MREDTGSCVTCYVTVAVLGVTAVLIYLRRSRKRRDVQHPPDTVILHQLGKGVHAPSLSPFVIKLETYLRMAKIPYQSLYDRQMSSEGKTPWIEYNGEAVPDSAFCIEFLNERYSVNLSGQYSDTDRAVARAFVKMLEENTYWYIGLSRCVYDAQQTIFRKVGLGYIIRKILERKARSAAWYHGIGRHSQSQVEHIATLDLQALATFLGNKSFLLGETPCEEDCAVFGQLCQFVWQMPGSAGEKAVLEKYPTLKQYCLRMRQKYWPDWNERVLENI